MAAHAHELIRSIVSTCQSLPGATPALINISADTTGQQLHGAGGGDAIARNYADTRCRRKEPSHRGRVLAQAAMERCTFAGNRLTNLKFIF